MPRLVLLFLGIALLSGCSRETPTQPASMGHAQLQAQIKSWPAAGPASRPGYEPAYYGGSALWINAIEVPNKAPYTAQADFYEVVYPIGWQSLGLAPPQCNPCDHEGNGIDFTDYHDHILDSMPGSPGHGEFSPLWHVFVVIPNYNHEPDHDAAVSQAYASHLPTKSEAAVDALLAAKDASGQPIAIEVDTHFYFLCAVVNPPRNP